MKAVLHFFAGMILLGTTVLVSPSMAQPYGGPSQAPQLDVPPPAPVVNDWGNERFERQSFREEMEEIRREHEDIERAQDRIDVQCGAPAMAQPASCDMERASLQQRRLALRARRMNLRDRMAEARQQRGENAQNLWPPAVGAPAMGTPAGPP